MIGLLLLELRDHGARRDRSVGLPLEDGSEVFRFGACSSLLAGKLDSLQGLLLADFLLRPLEFRLLALCSQLFTSLRLALLLIGGGSELGWRKP